MSTLPSKELHEGMLLALGDLFIYLFLEKASFLITEAQTLNQLYGKHEIRLKFLSMYSDVLRFENSVFHISNLLNTSLFQICFLIVRS